MSEICPECSKPLVTMCRCFLTDGFCEDGHESFVCRQHGRVILVGDYEGHPNSKDNCPKCSGPQMMILGQPEDVAEVQEAMDRFREDGGN